MGIFFDSEAIETRLNPEQDSAKYNELYLERIRKQDEYEDNVSSSLGNNSIKDIWAFARNGNIFVTIHMTQFILE